VRAAAIDPRLDPAHPLPARLPQLLARLAERQEHGAGERERTDEEVEPTLRRTQRPAGVAEMGHRDDALRGVAREQVANAYAAAGEQALAVRQAALDLGRVGRSVRDEQSTRSLLEPSESRDPVIRPEEDAGLARRRLRRE